VIDSEGRKVNYLRLSITDRCNLRCRYCMPAGGVKPIAREDILSFEECLLLARTAVELGIEKIRVTGGEPLVRKGVIDFLERLANIPALKMLALTTNGLMLKEKVFQLKDAGVRRLNVSLDSLRPEVFEEISRSEAAGLKRILEGIRLAVGSGIPVKINTVMMRGINDGEILDFIRLAEELSLTVRFIEYMPVLQDGDWRTRVVSGHEILEAIERRYHLDPLSRTAMCGPARDYRISGTRATIGVITPVFTHFCNECNRIRVTSEGRVKSCLFSEKQIDLRQVLRSGDTEALRQTLLRVVSGKPPGRPFTEDRATARFPMSRIGG